MEDLIPKEGATGWADTWMLSAHAKHPNCAYKWMKWVSTPKVQAQQAISFGETPANTKACAIMDKLSPRAPARSTTRRPGVVLRLDQVLEDADRRLRQRQERLHGLHAWQQKWTQLKGLTVASRRAAALRAARLRRLAASSGAGRGCGPAVCSPPPLACVRADLPRVARRAVRLGVLDGQPVHDRDRAHLEPRQLPHALRVDARTARSRCARSASRRR